MAPVGSSAKGGLSGSSSVTSKTAENDLPGSSIEGTGNSGADSAADFGAGAPPPGAASPFGTGTPVVDKDAPVYRSAIEPIVKGDPSATSGGGGGRTYAWGPEAPMPPRSDPDIMEWCLVDGKWVPCKLTSEASTVDAPTYDPSKEREPEAFRMLLGSLPFNTQEATPWPGYYDVYEDQNGFMLNASFIVQIGATLPRPDGTPAFSWWDVLWGPYLRAVYTPKGRSLTDSTYVDSRVSYHHTSAGNSNAGVFQDVQEGDTVTFYLYYETDPLSEAKKDYFKAPPLAYVASLGEKPVAFPPGAYDAFVADTKHVHKLGSFVIRNGNAILMVAPQRTHHWLDQITIPRSTP
jgi:hypothetical protein